MIQFPNSKINLGLHIVAKRNDGYHNIETVFFPLLHLQDALEAVRGNTDTGLQFTSTGLSIQGDSNNNLCVKAYQLLKRDYPHLPAVQMHLHKVIPMGAGLGGGSADGTYTLLLLNQLFQLQLSATSLLSYALELGSDCPFFVYNQPCLATGRGEKMEPLSIDLSAYKMVLVNPGIHVPTAWAFAQITPQASPQPISDILAQPIEYWRQHLVNDFEQPVMQAYPEIQAIKDQLYHAGASYASMTGTGSSVFGLFPVSQSPSLSYPAHYFVHTAPCV